MYRALEAAASKTLEKDPADRFRRMEELIVAIGASDAWEPAMLSSSSKIPASP